MPDADTYTNSDADAIRHAPFYFDSNAAIGANTFGLGDPELDLSGLIDEMDHAGVGAALVYQFAAREFSPVKGNAGLIDKLDSIGSEFQRRIFPCAIWCPLEEGFAEDPVLVARELRNKGFVAVRAYPSEYNFVLDPRIMSEHLESLSSEKLPLFIESGQIVWSDLIDILDSFPALKVILSGEMYRTGRIVVPLLRRYGNFYFETCGFETHRGIEELVAAGVAEQLLFASRVPEFSIGPAKMMIDFAFIDDATRAKIAGGNLMRILGIEQL